MDTGERYGSWRVVGAAGNVAWVSGTYEHDGLTFPVQGNPQLPDEYSWVNLAGLSQSATGIAHIPVPTVVGSTYVLTFYVGNIYDPTGIYGTASRVAVYENSRFMGYAANSGGAGTATENWKFYSWSFQAESRWTTIAFINGDPPGDMNCGIDNINLVEALAEKGGTSR